MTEKRMRMLDRRQFLQLTGIGLSAATLATLAACVPTESTTGGATSNSSEGAVAASATADMATSEAKRMVMLRKGKDVTS